MFVSLLVANLKMIFRNKQSLFWVLAFPLIFTTIFGFFYGGNKSTIVGTVAWSSASSSEISSGLKKLLSDSGLVTVLEVDSPEIASEKVKDGDAAVAVIVPEGFGTIPGLTTAPSAPGTETPSASSNQISLITDPGQIQATAVVRSMLDTFLTQTSFTLQNAQPLFRIEQTQANKNDVSYFDFVMMGIIGLALMNSNIQGTAIALARYREDKIIKRLLTTPLKPWMFILAEMTARLIVNAIQVTLILLVGTLAFKAHIYGSIPAIYLLSLFGAILFQALGFVVFALSKTTQATEGMATAIAIPMMFLAGVFFPTDTLPNWLATIVRYLPLSPLLALLRKVGLESASIFSEPRTLLLLGSWILILLLIAVRKFRLKDE